jgi:predicted P-loop ATPase
MSKLRKRGPRRNDRAPSLPLLEFLERRRWDDVPREARWLARRFGIGSPSAARTIAHLAGLGADKC